MKKEYTKGEWMLPCFTNEDTVCNCGYVFNEAYDGSICNVNYSLDRSLKNGDNPSLKEAIANAKLICASHDLLEELIKSTNLLENISNAHPESLDIKRAIENNIKAINKALE